LGGKKYGEYLQLGKGKSPFSVVGGKEDDLLGSDVSPRFDPGRGLSRLAEP